MRSWVFDQDYKYRNQNRNRPKNPEEQCNKTCLKLLDPGETMKEPVSAIGKIHEEDGGAQRSNYVGDDQHRFPFNR